MLVEKTQPPVNRQRVLEELVDVYHFVMTWELYQSDNDIDFIIKEYGYYIIRFGMGVTGALGNFIGAVASNFEKLDALLDLTEMLGFSFDEIYQEYLNKNKINYERLKNGY